MVRGEEGTDHIKNWMRNRNTVEFLGLWETMNNPDFKGVEFDTFRKEAAFLFSVRVDTIKNWKYGKSKVPDGVMMQLRELHKAVNIIFNDEQDDATNT